MSMVIDDNMSVVNNFNLHSNGVTIICTSAEVEDTATINSVEYIKRNKGQITTTNAVTTCTSGINEMSSLFDSAASFNQDIDSWDVSSVMDMNSMFSVASSFNQDLNSWCVNNIISEPLSFAETTFLSTNRPNWGQTANNNYYNFYLKSKNKIYKTVISKEENNKRVYYSNGKVIKTRPL